MIKKLTLSQSLKFYFLGGLIIALFATLFIIDLGHGSDNSRILDLLEFHGFMIILGVLFVLMRKNQLRFKEFSFKCTNENFEQALKQTAKENEWEIQSFNNNEFIALQRIYFSVYLLITIIKKDSVIYINCIQNPDRYTFELALGWRKRNIKTFINKLSYLIDGTYYYANRVSIWDIIIRVMVIIGYLSAIMFLLLSIIAFFYNETLGGIIFGVLGVLVLGPIIYKFFKKPNH